jgi:uncharacterized membrane protein
MNDAGLLALGFVMEVHDNDTITVFVPSTPTVSIGSVYVVASDQVTILDDISAMDFVDSISKWGIGSSRILNQAKG